MSSIIKADRFDVENLIHSVLAEKVLLESQIKLICDKVNRVIELGKRSFK